MKKFISKNWKNILIVIGAVFIIVDLFYIITKPATITQDFLEYGPNIESDIFDGANNITQDVTNNSDSSGDIVNTITSNNSLISPTLARALLIFAFLFIVILVFSSIFDSSSSSSKKK